jgi:TRAP-type C4-dicarboxylate transport system permease small subunit
MAFRTALSRLAGLHDTASRLTFYVAAVCLAVIVLSYTYEVGARYLFSAPTTWAASLVAYMLCAMVFLSIPELTRQRVHIFISIFLDTMAPERARRIQRVTFLIAAVACLFAAGFCADATYQQYQRGISTLNVWRIPKWWLSATIVYGLFSTSIHYFRHFLSGVPYQTSEAM